MKVQIAFGAWSPVAVAQLETLGSIERMFWKYITIVVLAISIVLTAVLIVGSFIDYAPGMRAEDMQNIYLGRILTFGVPIIVLQSVALILAFIGRRCKDAA